MTRYSVSYEIAVLPTNVIVELMCKDEKEARALFLDKKANIGLLNVKINEKVLDKLDKT
jgi:hypothetical protein